MIAEKLRMIKTKSTEPIISSHSQNISNTATNSLSSQEITQISTRLQQIRPQIPQIDKLLSLHAKLATTPPNTLEMVKKLTDCRNVLVNQIDSTTQQQQQAANKRDTSNSFVMNLSQLNLLIDTLENQL